jgi:UBX domain
LPIFQQNLAATNVPQHHNPLRRRQSSGASSDPRI